MKPVRSFIKVAYQGDIAIITLDRPESRNAINYQLGSEASSAVRNNQHLNCIVITGTDPAFCAGMDLKDLGTEHLGDVPRLIEAIDESIVPVIGAINGPAITAGIEVALSCDFLIASERAAFADTHGRVGVYPGPVLYALPATVGPSFALEMSLTGNFVDAHTALRIGLVNHVTKHEDLLPKALGLAQDIASQDREMILRIKEGHKAIVQESLKDGREVWRKYINSIGRNKTRGSDIAGHRQDVIKRSKEQREKLHPQAKAGPNL